jgi:hypothetical protein
MKQTPLKRKSAMKRGRGFAASPAQQRKAQEEPCIVTAYHAAQSYVVDPAHLCAKAQGGCDDPLCVVPLWRPTHRQFDDGEFDLLPYLVKHRVPELQHALGHYDGDLIGLLNRLTGESFVPESLYRRES